MLQISSYVASPLITAGSNHLWVQLENKHMSTTILALKITNNIVKTIRSEVKVKMIIFSDLPGLMVSTQQVKHTPESTN